MIETFDAVLPHGITLSCRATGRSDAPRKFDRRIAPAASDIQHAIAATNRQRRKHFCAMQVEAAGKDVPPGIEFRNQHGVPEFDVLVAGIDDRRGFHDQDSRF